MKQKDKTLLLKDLSARLPYGVICTDSRHGDSRITEINTVEKIVYCYDFDEYIELGKIKPYLRPMSSMTLEEIEEFRHFKDYLRESECKIHIANYNQIQWLLEKHFDFMGLIPKGLAIEVTEENNPYK
jgi:hypothetical protein